MEACSPTSPGDENFAVRKLDFGKRSSIISARSATLSPPSPPSPAFSAAPPAFSAGSPVRASIRPPVHYPTHPFYTPPPASSDASSTTAPTSVHGPLASEASKDSDRDDGYESSLFIHDPLTNRQESISYYPNYIIQNNVDVDYIVTRFPDWLHYNIMAVNMAEYPLARCWKFPVDRIPAGFYLPVWICGIPVVPIPEVKYIEYKEKLPSLNTVDYAFRSPSKRLEFPSDAGFIGTFPDDPWNKKQFGKRNPARDLRLQRVIVQDQLVEKFLDTWPQAEAIFFLGGVGKGVVVMNQEYRHGVREGLFPERFAGFKVEYVEPETIKWSGKSKTEHVRKRDRFRSWILGNRSEGSLRSENLRGMLRPGAGSPTPSNATDVSYLENYNNSRSLMDVASQATIYEHSIFYTHKNNSKVSHKSKNDFVAEMFGAQHLTGSSFIGTVVRPHCKLARDGRYDTSIGLIIEINTGGGQHGWERFIVTSSRGLMDSLFDSLRPRSRYSKKPKDIIALTEGTRFDIIDQSSGTAHKLSSIFFNYITPQILTYATRLITHDLLLLHFPPPPPSFSLISCPHPPINLATSLISAPIPIPSIDPDDIPLNFPSPHPYSLRFLRPNTYLPPCTTVQLLTSRHQHPTKVYDPEVILGFVMGEYVSRTPAPGGLGSEVVHCGWVVRICVGVGRVVGELEGCPWVVVGCGAGKPWKKESEEAESGLDGVYGTDEMDGGAGGDGEERKCREWGEQLWEKDLVGCVVGFQGGWVEQVGEDGETRWGACLVPKLPEELAVDAEVVGAL